MKQKTKRESRGATIYFLIECFRGGHRGGAIFIHVCGSPDPFLFEPSLHSNLHPREGNPLGHRLVFTPRMTCRITRFLLQKNASLQVEVPAEICTSL